MFESENPLRISKSLEILGIPNANNQSYVLDKISSYIFDTNSKGIGKSKKNFDINYDYKYYFPDFLKYGINLNKQDIDWWEFNQILEAIMLDETSNMHNVMKYRTYVKPIENEKTNKNIRHQQMMKLKQKYALPFKDNIKNGFEKMWGYLEKKAGEKKE